MITNLLPPFMVHSVDVGYVRSCMDTSVLVINTFDHLTLPLHGRQFDNCLFRKPDCQRSDMLINECKWSLFLHCRTYFTHYAHCKELKPLWHTFLRGSEHVTSCDRGEGWKVYKKRDVIIEWILILSYPYPYLGDVGSCNKMRMCDGWIFVNMYLTLHLPEAFFNLKCTK